MYTISINNGKPIRVDSIDDSTFGRLKFTRIWKDGTKENFNVPIDNVSISEIEDKTVEEYWEEKNANKE